MPRSLLVFTVLVYQFFLPVLGFPQTPAAPPAEGQSKEQAEKFAGEPYVIEFLSTKIRFENDGTGIIESYVRVRIQSESALTTFGLLAFPYMSDSQEFHFDAVRVQKADGTLVTTPLDTAQDITADVTRAAPLYTDLHEKHLAVKGLSVGDTLEIRDHLTIRKAVTTGQFWYSRDFFHDGIVLRDEVEINLPRERPVKILCSKAPAAVTEEGGRRITVYRTSNLEKKPAAKSKWEKALEEPPPPAIQITSFQSWDEVARWYDSLQKPQLQLSPEIRAKAEELTRGKSSDLEKIRAIYDYVAIQFRYISISLGAGRYMPHVAADVLANQYGDCKDKHTLFAALLQAAGIKALPALISTHWQADASFPTPQLFDHVISAIPQGDSHLWLDTTPGIAPFGMLLQNLRHKSALVVGEGGASRLAVTPANPPFPNIQNFRMEAKIDENGTLDGKARADFRGDSEITIRQVFRSVAQTQWKELVQNISYMSGFAGTVANISAAAPDATLDPFWYSFSYHRPEFPDWPNHRVALALPPAGLPELSEEDAKSAASFPLGPTESIHYEAIIRLPAGYTPLIPAQVEIKRAFAEYSAVYSFEGQTLRADRKLTTVLPEVPPGQRAAYRTFVSAMQEDERRFISLLGSGAAADMPAEHTGNPEAQRYLDQGRQSLQSGNFQSAVSFLEHAVQLDPKSSEAWSALGAARQMMRNYSGAADAYHKAIALDPKNVKYYKLLAFGFMSIRRTEDAIQVWRDLLKVAPEDRDAPANLGPLLLAARDYPEARSILEKAVEKNPDTPQLHLQLSTTYLHLGEEEKATTQIQKALELQPGPEMLNSVAYTLADLNQRLPDALLYAKQAVHATEEETQDLSLDDLDETDYRRMSQLAAEWDTLGWVHFRLGHLEEAQKFAEAAWTLWQTPEIGDHLSQIYEKQNNKKLCVKTLALATAASGMLGDEKLRAKLNKYFIDSGKEAAEIDDARNTLSQMRTVHLEAMGKGYKSAEFAILFTKGPKIEGVRFLSGAEELRQATSRLMTAKYKVEFPDDIPAKIVRRAVLSCSEVRKECIFVLYPVEAIAPVIP